MKLKALKSLEESYDSMEIDFFDCSREGIIEMRDNYYGWLDGIGGYDLLPCAKAYFSGEDGKALFEAIELDEDDYDEDDENEILMAKYTKALGDELYAISDFLQDNFDWEDIDEDDENQFEDRHGFFWDSNHDSCFFALIDPQSVNQKDYEDVLSVLSPHAIITRK